MKLPNKIKVGCFDFEVKDWDHDVADAVEVDQHRRAGGADGEELTETPERVATERLILRNLVFDSVTDGFPLRILPLGIDVGVEVIIPEPGHHLLQLA